MKLDIVSFISYAKAIQPGISPRLKDPPLKQPLLSGHSSPPSYQGLLGITIQSMIPNR
jgi:hypothetical protein